MKLIYWIILGGCVGAVSLALPAQNKSHRLGESSRPQIGLAHQSELIRSGGTGHPGDPAEPGALLRDFEPQVETDDEAWPAWLSESDWSWADRPSWLHRPPGTFISIWTGPTGRATRRFPDRC